MWTDRSSSVSGIYKDRKDVSGWNQKVTKPLTTSCKAVIWGRIHSVFSLVSVKKQLNQSGLKVETKGSSRCQADEVLKFSSKFKLISLRHVHYNNYHHKYQRYPHRFTVFGELYHSLHAGLHETVIWTHFSWRGLTAVTKTASQYDTFHQTTV